MKRKLFLSIFTLVIAFVSTVGVTYAFWNTLQKETQEVITISEGDTLTLEEVLKPLGTLIPEGHTPSVGEVNEVVLTYNLKVNQKAVEGDNVLLKVQVTDVLIGGVDTHIGLLNFVITGDNIDIGITENLVTIKVTLTEPIDETQYNEIINQEISFKVVFTIE